MKFESLKGKALSLYVLYDPSLANDGSDDSGSTSGATLLASDAKAASALTASPDFTATSNGYLGSSDGWTDLRNDFTLDGTYADAPSGNVVQTGKTALTGLTGSQNLRLGAGLRRHDRDAGDAATGALAGGFDAVASAYADGWHGYLAGLNPEPASAAAYGPTYDVSAMALAAHEDKTFRGAYVASPTMPWAWGGGTGLENPSGAYHLVWARDLYEIATALIADGDHAGADRALTYLFERSRRPTAPSRRTRTSMAPRTGPTSSSTRLRTRSSSPGSSGGPTRTTRQHVKKAADFLVGFHGAPFTPQERWENQSGYSPATIAAEIAGLICAADIARRNGDAASAARYRATADDWQKRIDNWTATTNGPYAPTAVLPAAHEGRQAEHGHDLRHRRQRARPASTSARSSTRASSSSSASASSRPTTRPCATRSPSSTT